MDFTADTDIFLADFAATWIVRNLPDADGSVSLIFNGPGRVLSPFADSPGMVTSGPSALVKTADVAVKGIVLNRTLLIAPDGVEHQATEMLADGAGMSFLSLTRDFE